MRVNRLALCPVAAALFLAACQAPAPLDNTYKASDTNNKVVYTANFDEANKDSAYPVVIDLYQNKKPQFVTTLNKDEVLTDTDTFVTDISSPKLYAFKAEKPNGYGVIILPGGGYFGSAMQHEGFDVATWFNKQGFSAFVLKYRTPNKVDQIPLEDVNTAADLIVSMADEFGLDPSKIGVFGSSAGGHLAATYTAYATQQGLPAFSILLYPVITFDDEIASISDSKHNLVGYPKPGSELELKYSLEKQVKPTTAKTFIALNADDDTPPEHSIRYFRSLLANKVNATMHIYPNGGHGFGFRENFKYHDRFMSELKNWLDNEVIGK
ncbi:Predicted esterase [Anaerobiospirillum thomasii]|uniref:Predicted esterase n=1 Tax=Anaerobiospirillum thomasii TaxID=179995 RepID=A0A2X0VJX1_9GAMM|nr:alpha/beta hydrolase [Anaerobiospirillum thomasii]SPT68000.1 Predicted esterase [Anaerobiospirillum thomasii]SPT70465.1 Predicted esterase [Anaerobiospirillum thomasii]